MATLTIRNLDSQVEAALRIEATRHGRSLEDEVRVILKNAMVEAVIGKASAGCRARWRFPKASIEELDLPERTELPRAADFTE
jgi:plasmid stability protein